MEVRSYKSPHRARAATVTRHAILNAALELFERDGYASTSMAEIATLADVSLNTIYSSVGKKPQLLIALIRDAADDERIGDTLAAVTDEETLEGVVALMAGGTRAVFEAHGWLLGVLYDNSAHDPVIAAAAEDVELRYRERVSDAAARLDEAKQLPPGFTADHASHVLWFHFGYRPWRELHDLGWSWDDAQAWLTRQAISALTR